VSVYVVGVLNSAIPTATAEDGSDATPQEPPKAPGPPGPNRPRTPPGQTGSLRSNAPVTPTHQLQDFSIKSPANRPPPVKTPERKTANDGEWISSTMCDFPCRYICHASWLFSWSFGKVDGESPIIPHLRIKHIVDALISDGQLHRRKEVLTDPCSETR
jgi:hypothetical protein